MFEILDLFSNGNELMLTYKCMVQSPLNTKGKIAPSSIAI
jgi:hypothetical protein